MKTSSNLTIVGLLGGVASGKSFVAQSLARRGAVLLDADQAGHAVLREPEVEAAARTHWGDGIFGPDGRIHRSALAQIVFGPPPKGPRELAYLESITHPRIEMRLRDQLDGLAASGKPTMVVLDAPVMLKAGWNRLCNSLVFVDAPPEVRIQRAINRGWTVDDFKRREASQEPVEEKRKLADWTIDNSGTQAETEAQIDRLWSRLNK
jgi:dephospho-CoA kinase